LDINVPTKEEVKFKDIDLEKMIIKLILTNKIVQDRAFPFLKLELFANEGHREIVKRILNFYEEFSKVPTLSDLRLQLSSEGTNESLKEVYLEILDTSVADYENEFLLKKVENFYKRRLISWKNTNIAMALMDNKLNEIPAIVNDLNNVLGFNFNDDVAFDMFAEDTGDYVMEFIKNTNKVVSSGIPSLDKYLNGGFNDDKLTVFTAESNLGKSLMMGSLAASCLLRNKKVLIVTMEQSNKVYTRRILSNILDMDMESFYNDEKKNEKLANYKKYKDRIKGKIFIAEYVPGITHNRILNLLTELKLKKNFVPDIIFVDYIKLMSSARLQKGANTNTQLQYVCEDLRSIPQTFKIPVVTAMQVNRGAYGSTIIDKKDTGDSIGIVQTADVVIGLSQPQDYKGDRETGLGKWLANFAKNRDGIADVSITLNVNYKNMRVSDDPSNTKQNTSVSTAEAVQKVLSKEETEKQNVVNTIFELVDPESGASQW